MTRQTPACFGTALIVLFAAVAAAAQAPADAQGQGGDRSGDFSASLKVDVRPRDTQVFVDGYYAGTADDFDGAFQQLHIEPGTHRIQLLLARHRLFTQDVSLQPGGSARITHTMQRLEAGEPEPVRPTGAASARRGPRPAPQRSAGSSPQDPYAPRPVDVPRGAQPANAAPATPGMDTARATAGSASIRIDPADAQLLVDGARWSVVGETGPLVIQLDAGAHTIEAKKDGYRGYITEVTIRSGETTPVSIALKPER